MFLTWHLARHLQMSKQSLCTFPGTVKATERALVLYSDTQIVCCWSDTIKVRNISNDPEWILVMHSKIKPIPPPSSVVNIQKAHTDI